MTDPVPGGHAGSVLVIDDDPFILLAMRQTLEMHHFEPDVCDKPIDALPLIKEGSYHAVVADIKMPKMNGLELLRHIREIDPELPVIMITGHGDVPMAVTALKEGAYDFLEKPVDEDVLLGSLRRAVEKMTLIAKNRSLMQDLERKKDGRTQFHNMVGFSSIMQKLYDAIEIVAREDYAVLISGETGTGKELVAKAVHDLSPRSGEKFVPINMGAIPDAMLESELFGHEAGAFTGAARRGIGKFEYAGRGTIFLDEICSMPQHLQGKLLRVIEERKLHRLGSNESVSVEARIIGASNKDLREEIEKGNFRADLYFRLNVIPITVPPLRERRDDIPLLVNHFLGEYNRLHDNKVQSVDRNMYRWMLQYDWPGNVRELDNFIKQLCLLNGSSAPAARGEGHLSLHGHSHGPGRSLRELLETAEREHIISALRHHQGQIIPAGASLGITRKSLYEKMKKYRLSKKDFRKA